MHGADPPYCEAHPRLIGEGFLRASRTGDFDLALCRFTSSRGDERGWLEILHPIEGGRVARWKLWGPGVDRLPGRHVIRFKDEPGKRGRPSPFTCPGCKRSVRNLVFKNNWQCGRCQGLRNRSTYLKRDVRDAEHKLARLDKLNGLIAQGRPPGMWHDTYRKLRDELTRLKTWSMSADFVTANRNRTVTVESEWMTRGDAWRLYRFEPDSYFRDYDTAAHP